MSQPTAASSIASNQLHSSAPPTLSASGGSNGAGPATEAVPLATVTSAINSAWTSSSTIASISSSTHPPAGSYHASTSPSSSLDQQQRLGFGSSVSPSTSASTSTPGDADQVHRAHNHNQSPVTIYSAPPRPFRPDRLATIDLIIVVVYLCLLLSTSISVSK